MSEKQSRVESRESRADGSTEAAYKAPRWAWWVATGFGSGCLKPAPGTWGSLAAVAVWWILLQYFRFPWLEKWVAFHGPVLPPLALALGMAILAIAASDRVVQETGLKDPSFIVADEWVGMWIALAPILWHVGSLSPGWGLLRVITPFALFRLFDIWKPWPCHQLQVLPGGTGVVIDDVAAGLYAAAGTFFIDSWLVQHVSRLRV
ncbi:MAG: phosphatidylglycerophosphatase A [Acidobacteriota bacterium]|nr:phosphatidylglycerophosphatase A [Acidobacteriota bacterium]